MFDNGLGNDKENNFANNDSIFNSENDINYMNGFESTVQNESVQTASMQEPVKLEETTDNYAETSLINTAQPDEEIKTESTAEQTSATTEAVATETVTTEAVTAETVTAEANATENIGSYTQQNSNDQSNAYNQSGAYTQQPNGYTQYNNNYNRNNYVHNQNGYNNYNMNGQPNYNTNYQNGYNAQNQQYYNRQNGYYNGSNQNNYYNAQRQNGYANQGWNANTANQNANANRQNAGQPNMNQQANTNQQMNMANNSNKSKGKGGKIFKKIVALIASAALFGVVAGGVMYGVYYAGTEIYPVNNNSNINLPITSTNISSTGSVSEKAEGVTAEMDVAAVAEASMPAMVALEGTVTVTNNSIFGGMFGGQSYEAATSGTGIIVSQNDTELLLLTNAHVVEDVNNLKCVFVDGEKVDCVVKGMKTDKDIAVVAVRLSDIKTETMSKIAIAELGTSEDVVLGQEVVAIGNALGEGQSVTNGIISALDRSITVDNVTFDGLFMTNAAINSGNSGGALLNADGKVIGINFAKTSEDGVEGMAYAIPVSTVRELIDSLMNRETRTKVEESQRGYLGIAGMDITNEMATYYKYPQGLLLTTVEEGSAADDAGLGRNDIIVGFDDQTVSSMAGLQTIMQYYKAGETITIEYYHLEGNQYVLKTTDVTLGNRK